MAIAPIERSVQTPNSVELACAALTDCVREVSRQGRVLSRPEALQFIVDIERASRIVDHLQVLAARLAEEHYAAAVPVASEPDPESTSGTASLLARAEQALRADAPTPSGPESASDTAFPGATSSGATSSGATLSDGRAGGARDCADFLRATLGVSRSEARRRLALAELVLPRMTPTGAALPPRLETLGAATEVALVSGRAATIVAQAVQRVHSFATPEQVESMEENLTRQAVESDEDILRVLARRWEGVLDQDGQEPTEKILRARQGVFLKGRRHGLHVLEIGATDEQFEHLATVMNATTNPRTLPSRTHAAGVSGAASAGAAGTGHAPGEGPESGSGAGSGVGTGEGSGEGTGWGAGSGTGTGLFDDPGGATRAQMLLEGLVTACRIALSTGGPPATGGHRPQVMVTIDYQDLTGDLSQDLTKHLTQVLTGRTNRNQRPGHAVFSEQLSARSIRRIACDADILPVVLGGAGQVLDLGRAQRLFPPHLRRALVARDKGCAFPDCTIPGPWCEAHHIDPWSRGGRTSISNGVLLCSRHHHLIHQGHWKVEPQDGIPWFHAPGHPGRAGTPRTNTYWHTGRIVHQQLLHEEPRHEELRHHEPPHDRLPHDQPHQHWLEATGADRAGQPWLEPT